jgi:hypothetical protein
MWSCEDFTMLKSGRGYVWGSFCHGLSIYVIVSQVIANCWKKVKQPSHSKVNQDHVILSFSLALSSSSYPLIFLFEGIAPKISWRKDFSWLFKSKFLFDKFSFFCGLYPVLDLHSMVFKHLNLHVYPLKMLKLSKADFGCPGKIRLSNFKTGLSGFLRFKPPRQNLPLHHFYRFSLTQEQPWGQPQDPHWWFLASSMESWSSWVKSTPQEPMSLFPQLVFPISRYFHLILNLFAPWMDLKFLWCIVFIHVIEQCPTISLSFLG